jgi:hypothetical protein
MTGHDMEGMYETIMFARLRPLRPTRFTASGVDWIKRGKQPLAD